MDVTTSNFHLSMFKEQPKRTHNPPRLPLDPEECISLAKNGRLWQTLWAIKKNNPQGYDALVTAMTDYIDALYGFNPAHEQALRQRWESGISGWLQGHPTER